MKQKYAIALMVLIAGLLLLVSLVVARSYTTVEKLVITVNDAPLEGDVDNLNISANGRYLIFEAYANNVDIGGNRGLFLYDLENDTREFINQGRWAWVTDDGRYVLSLNSNISYPYDTITTLYDRVEKTEIPVGKGLNGEPLNAGVYAGSMSPDGRYIVYYTNATNPFDGITTYCPKWENLTCYSVFLWDRVTDQHEPISVNSQGEAATNGYDGSAFASISDDGNYVLFASDAPNVTDINLNCIPTDETSCFPLYVRDRNTNTTELVSIAPNGTVLTDSVIHLTLYNFDLSGNGRYAVFMGNTNANNEQPDTNVYVRDIVNNVTEMVNVDTNEVRIPNAKNAGYSIISHDGRYVTFIGGDDLLYVRDRLEGVTTVASRDTNGTTGTVAYGIVNGSFDWSSAAISADGGVIVFASSSDTLIGATPGDTTEKLFLSIGAEVPATATPTTLPVETSTLLPTSIGTLPTTPTATATTLISTLDATASQTQTPNGTSTPEPTSTTVGCEPLLVNGDFETAGDTAKLAANWTPNSLDNHKRVQNKLDKTVAHSGEFAFQFKAASGVSSKLTQKVEGIATCGDTLTLSAWVEGKSLSGAKVQAKVVYVGGDSARLTLTDGELNAGTYAYKPLMAALPLTDEIEQIKVQISLKNGTGRLRIDDADLQLVTNTLPLP